MFPDDPSHSMLDPSLFSLFAPSQPPTLASLASLLPFPPAHPPSLPFFAPTSTSTVLDPLLSQSNKRTWDDRDDDGSGSEDWEVDEMEDDPHELKLELKRVRKQLRRQQRSVSTTTSTTTTTTASGGVTMLVGGGGAGGEGGRGGRETSQQSSTSTSFPSFHRLATPTSLVGGGGEESSLDGYVDESDATTAASGSVSNVKGKKGRTKKGSVSGKKESAGRKVALNKSIRAKMRQLMGIEEKDPLPDPDETPAFDEEGRELCRPNWRVSITNGHNKKILNQITTELLSEAWLSIREPERGLPRTEIPVEDLDQGVVLKAAKTTFTNFSKKFLAENDPSKKDHLERDAKRGRRWARKDR